MREIKFRAWDDVKNKMYYIGEDDNTEFTFDSNNIVAIDVSEDEEEFKTLYHFQYMQFTGLKDKNDVDVYEGDIIVAHTFDEDISKKKVGKVVYHNERFGYVFIPKELEKNNLYYPLFAIVTCELIGNIYENKELLKQQHANYVDELSISAGTIISMAKEGLKKELRTQEIIDNPEDH